MGGPSFSLLAALSLLFPLADPSPICFGGGKVDGLTSIGLSHGFFLLYMVVG